MSEEDDLKAVEVWGLRLLDVERLNGMYRLLASTDNDDFKNEVQGWIDDYLEMMRYRNRSMVERHENDVPAVVVDREAEKEHLGRIKLVRESAMDVYGDVAGDLADVVVESCYKADFKAWLETRLQGWYVERFGYDDKDVEFLTLVRERVYGDGG